MKAKEVMQVLRISRNTLGTYIKKGFISYNKLPNGYYDYSKDDVYKFLNKNVKREICIYARVSTNKQKNDLENQLELLKQYCFTNGLQISSSYADIASGISFEKRKEFFKLLDKIVSHRVEKVIITYKDRLSRVGFELFKYFFEKFGCEIVVISEVGSKKLDSAEIFEEIVSLLHCYSMKMYSNRRTLDKIKEAIQNGES